MGAEFDKSRKLLEELIGSKAELLITSGLYKGSYPSRLEEIENELLGVAHPMLREALLPALRSSELVMKIETDNGFYQATVTVLRSTVNVTVPLLWVKLLTPLEKVQRRMFVRVASSLKAEMFFLEPTQELEEGAEFPPKEWLSVRISDISLGGVGIFLKENQTRYCLESGRYLLRMHIGDSVFFVVSRLAKIFRKDNTTIGIGIAYESLPISTEKLMGAYIRQQEFMTRG